MWSKLYTHFRGRSTHAQKLLIPVLCIAALILSLRLGIDLVGSNNLQGGEPSTRPLVEIPATAQQVKTGLYVTKLYELNTSSNTYYADFYMWFQWKGDIDPIANLEFVNAVEEWGMSQVPTYEEPKVLPDGSLYQMVRVEGRFVHPFELTRYPLDQQRLAIQIENTDATADELVYVADIKGSGMAEDLIVPGWTFQAYRLQNLVHVYPTQFGDPTVDYTYSALRYEIDISRPTSFFVWKLLLPLVIVLFASWGALMLNPTFSDSRILLPVTALLTIVFLQQSYSSTLPEVGYLVLLDKIYVLAYVLVIAALMEVIITADWMNTDESQNHSRVVRLDRLFLGGQFIVLTAGIATLILL